MDVPRDVRREHSSTDDLLLAGLEALLDRVRRKTNATLFVSNEYLSCRFVCITEPIGFIMNKHIYPRYVVAYWYTSQTHDCLAMVINMHNDE